jgi:hypothetical protein
MSSSGHPRVPSRVARYNPNAQRAAAAAAAAAASSGSGSADAAESSVEEPPADWLALASLLLGVLGLMMRVSAAATADAHAGSSQAHETGAG